MRYFLPQFINENDMDWMVNWRITFVWHTSLIRNMSLSRKELLIRAAQGWCVREGQNIEHV